MDRSQLLLLTIFGLTLLFLVPGCGENEGTGPGAGAENFGTLAAGMDIALATYFIQNAETFESLDFFVPLIGALYASAPPSPGKFLAPAQSCLVPSVVQEIFEYNGATYVNSGQPGPADGQRFLLYEVVDGIPNTANQIGHVDVVCTSALPTVNLTITVVNNSVTIIEITLSGQYNTFPNITDVSGFLASNDGSTTLPIFKGEVSGLLSLQIGMGFVILPDVGAEYAVRENLASGDITIIAKAFEGFETEKWRLDINMSANSSGNISDGTAIFEENLEQELVGCFSGTVDAPNVSDPDQVGCSVEGIENRKLSREDLDAMIDAYGGLLIMYDSLRPITEVGLGAIHNQS